MDTSNQTAPKDEQENVGYENTSVRNNDEDKENDQAQTSEPGSDGKPAEKKDDTAGLRSESGKKSQGSESGNNEEG